MLLKPTRGLRLNKSHTLTRGLVGLWLMNEGSGNKVFDLSGNGNTGTLLGGDVSWAPGKYGTGLNFPGSAGDYVEVSHNDQFANSTGFSFSFVLKLNQLPSVGGTYIDIIENRHVGSPWRSWRFYSLDTDDKLYLQIVNAAGASSWSKYDTALELNRWYAIIATCDGTTQRLYVDGVLVDSDNLEGAGGVFQSDLHLAIGSQGVPPNVQIDHAMIYNRALSASEIALLYREPFCMFENPIRLDLVGSQIVNLVGTTATLSSLSATAKTMRKVVGNVTSISDVEALLNSIRDRLETERNWLKEALFNGMTANAFKLGTTLSLGWFWVRIGGCSVLYRGSGMGEIDFVNILAVAESEACEISGPSYIPHNNGSTYFYVIRRFNNCGYQEYTLSAAVKVSIDSNGNLAVPQPNNIFSSKVEQVNVNKIQLVWFYCPLEQQSQPICFNVYYDDRTGQINYQNPLATIGYKGRKFYSHQTNALEASKYLFAIRPEDTNDIENSSLARLRIQLDTTSLDAINILRAEAV